METQNYASIITTDSKTKDIASLGQKLTVVPVLDESHIIKTELIYLGKCEFKKIFFSRDGENFELNKNLCEKRISLDYKQYYESITFNNRLRHEHNSVTQLNLEDIYLQIMKMILDKS